MSVTLRISLLVAMVFYFGLMSYFFHRKRMSVKFSLLWFLSGGVMLVFVIFPALLSRLTNMVGIASPMNGLFAIALFFVITLIMSLTSIVSGQAERLRALTQSQALLEERIRKLEGRE